jgi:uncharacterized membrane protein YhhN
MRREAFVAGVLCMLIAFVLTSVLTHLEATYANLQPLAILVLILAGAGAVIIGYSIWDEVSGKTAPAQS